MLIVREIFRHIPSVNDILNEPDVIGFAQELSRTSVVNTIRSIIAEVRDDIQHQRHTWNAEEIHVKIVKGLSDLKESPFKRVMNATGVLIHTNLGRSPISKDALRKAVQVAQGYSTVEFNLKKGKRGERIDLIEKMLCMLTGSESALVVNNNAAAVMLCLNTISKDKEAIVSRGELVEIGNSFRIPEIMSMSGAYLKEVGTTNKTKLKDYDSAISNVTGMVLKIHTSNYDIVGFTEAAALRDIVRVAHIKKRPVLFDAGSGLLQKNWPLDFYLNEPVIADAVKTGADLITFSGDKLLGGPQSGIIVGRKRWLDKIKRSPLYRVLRVDKLILATLEETLRHYILKSEHEKIPYLKMLATSMDTLEERAKIVKKSLESKLGELKFVQIQKDISHVGGGSFPSLKIPTIVMTFQLNRRKLKLFEAYLRNPKDIKKTPIIGRTHNGRFYIDFRALFDSDLPELTVNLHHALIATRKEAVKGFIT